VPAVDVAECVQRLLHGFTTYDRAVDVVSAFEMAFTTSNSDVPGTVRRFERFPRIPTDGGATLTPDFTVVFNDGTGLVGEIARLALHENSAESLCRQIEKYDALRQLPDGSGMTAVSQTDVLLLVPQAVGVAAVKRMVVDRFANPEHPYKPSVAPCVVQFAFDEDRRGTPQKRTGRGPTAPEGGRCSRGQRRSSRRPYPSLLARTTIARVRLPGRCVSRHLYCLAWSRRWRRRESNPRPRSRQDGFYERSRRS